MKRTVLLTTILVITLFTTISLVMAQPPTPSVPSLINFQGRLMDNLGNPVANGAHTVDFYIFPVRTGGVSVWSETQTPTTTGGLFTTQLGLVNPLPSTLFADYDSLFLEIVADGNTISPRTLLSSTPSSRVANELEVSPVPGIVVAKTVPFWCQMSTYGADAQEQIRLWGCSWGEVLLFDGDPSNDLTAVLSAGPSAGGSLQLYGNSSIFLDAASTGDASAVLPTDAINSGEILDEPGVASTYKDVVFVPLTGIATAYDTITITVPAAGYIVVMAYGHFYFSHTNGTEDVLRAYISDSPGGQDFDNFAIVSYPAVAASGTNSYTSFSITKTVAVGPGSYTYYLDADYFSGAGDIGRPRMTAMFFPTNYGTVASTKPIAARVGGNVAASLDAVGTNQPSEVQVTTVANHQARLEAERAKQIAELEARIKRLEEQARLQTGQESQMLQAPRKER